MLLGGRPEWASTQDHFSGGMQSLGQLEGCVPAPSAPAALPQLLQPLVPPCPRAECGDDQSLLESLTGQGLKNVLVSVSRLSAQRGLGSTVSMPLLVLPLFSLQTGRQNSEAEGVTPTTSRSRKGAPGYTPRAEASARAPGLEGGRVGHCFWGTRVLAFRGECPSPPADSGVWGRSWEHTWGGFVFPSEAQL